jgi:hypothetical protein
MTQLQHFQAMLKQAKVFVEVTVKTAKCVGGETMTAMILTDEVNGVHCRFDFFDGELYDVFMADNNEHRQIRGESATHTKSPAS